MNIDDMVGESGHWELPGQEEPVVVDGVFLGVGSSRASRHWYRAHPSGSADKPYGRSRCSACRWSEFRIFREDKDGRPVDDRPYLVHFTGRSIVPGESDRCRIEEMLTGREVVEVLTTRSGGKAYLSAPAARALAQSATFDRGALTAAYDARIVA